MADAGYGVSAESRAGLAARGLTDLVGVTEDRVAFPGRPNWVSPRPATGGRPQTRRRRAEGSPPPPALGELAKRVRLRRVTWREGSKGKWVARFARRRVGPGPGWRRGECADAAPVWLLTEERAGGKLKCALSNPPPGTRCRRAARLWKSRWPVEQGCQRLKEASGLDHFAGRSWRGFHHRAALPLLACGFRSLGLQRARPKQPRGRTKGVPSRCGPCRGCAAPDSACCGPW